MKPRRLILLTGVVALLAGLGLLGWIGWQYFGTGIGSNNAMDDARGALREQWKSGQAPQTATGRPTVLLRIPKFGPDWEKPVLEGVGDRELARGIGHYPQTQQPGQLGNFAIAGHRITHGSPFRKLLDLRKGDEVVVESADAIHTYVLDGSARDLTVKPSANWVLQPVPGKPQQTATQSIITLTTCQDLFHSPDRSVVFGHLVRTSKKR